MLKILHITNGDSLNDHLKTQNIQGDFVVWREILCEGKTAYKLDGESFEKLRKEFLLREYDASATFYDSHFISQLRKLKSVDEYEEIILWFEYDLFCHINMMAAISYLQQLGNKQPVYLVCSGRVEGSKELKGLSELDDAQLLGHFETRVQLNSHDLELADRIWRLYCEEDHTLLQPHLAKGSNFKYLSNCLSAHKERFPEATHGLNTLEMNLLKLIEKHHITSENQLCGYLLQYQGYYGYGDSQLFKMIKRMSPFFKKEDDCLQLTAFAKAVLEGKSNAYDEVKYDCNFGGAKKFDYLYETDSHQLIKR